jgi:hypothetical protein
MLLTGSCFCCIILLSSGLFEALSSLNRLQAYNIALIYYAADTAFGDVEVPFWCGFLPSAYRGVCVCVCVCVWSSPFLFCIVLSVCFVAVLICNRLS